MRVRTLSIRNRTEVLCQKVEQLDGAMVSQLRRKNFPEVNRNGLHRAKGRARRHQLGRVITQ